MSNVIDEGAHISPVRPPVAPAAMQYREAAAEAPMASAGGSPAYEISISPEAKAALETVKKQETAARAETAIQGAKEIAAAAGLSESEAVQLAQPLRSPPPAKGVTLFQANLTSVEAG